FESRPPKTSCPGAPGSPDPPWWMSGTLGPSPFSSLELGPRVSRRVLTGAFVNLSDQVDDFLSFEKGDSARDLMGFSIVGERDEIPLLAQERTTPRRIDEFFGIGSD